jgi:WD40 repeat protein/serine/threonine protein kinase
MNDPVREIDDRLGELLLAWEESVAAGEPLSAAVLCGESPELVPALEREIGRLRAVDRFIYAEANRESAAVPGATGPNGDGPRFPSLPGYELLEELGRGGMGVVYKARQHSLNRLVAVKTLAGGRWAQPGFVARLRQEALALSQINHRGVVQVMDIIETDHAVSIVLEYVDGESLSRRQHGAPLPSAEAARMTLTIARILAAVHRQGNLHRDVKPGNVLVSRTGEIKISDFGLAKQEGTTEGLTMTGELLGSPAYMAPEQAQGRLSEVGVRTDVYAIGATLYELLTGRPPFQAASHVEILRQVVDADPVSPKLLIPGIPRDLETVALKCLEKDPARRFASANELADELERFLNSRPILSRPIGPFSRFWRWCRRRPAAAALVAVSAAAALVVVAGLTVHYRNLTKYTSDLKRLNDELTAATTTARRMQGIAEENERQAKDALYASDMNRAAIAWRDSDIQGLTELLERHVPRPDEPDRRGFEWWYLHRRTTLARQVLLEVGSPVYQLSYSPDRRQLAAAGKDSTVRLLDPDSGEVGRVLPTQQLEINGVSFSPDGAELATAGDDGTVHLWNLETGAERLKISAHPDKAFVALFASAGARIVTCGNDPLIHVFDARSGAPVATLEGHSATVQTLVLAGDGSKVVSGCNDRTARIWDLESGRELSRVTATGAVRSLAVTRNLDVIITGSDTGFVESWNARDGRKIGEVKHLDAIESLALHPEGRLLAAGDRSGGIRVWQLGPDGQIDPDGFRVWQAHQRITYSLAWSNDGTDLVSAGLSGRVIRWQFASAARDAGPFRFTVGNGNSFSLIPRTHSLLTTAFEQRRLIRWDWKTGNQEESLAECPFDDVRVSPDARSIGLRAKPAALRVYPFAESFHGVLGVPTLDWSPAGAIGGMRFSPDSRSLAVTFEKDGGANNPDHQSAWIHGPPDFQERESLAVPGAKTVAFAPGGERLAVGTDSTLVLWDIAGRSAVWKSPQADFSSLEFSPDGKFLVAGGVGRLVVVRDAADGRIRFRLASHRARIEAFAFSPDGRTLATTSADGVIKLWHVPTGQELFELRGPGADCNRLEFAGDGRHLVTLVSHPGPNQDEILVFQAEDD